MEKRPIAILLAAAAIAAAAACAPKERFAPDVTPDDPMVVGAIEREL